LIHWDAVNRRIRGRRGSRLLALTSGGAIPDNADYRVLLEPSQTIIGTVNEDFAVESMAGDIFQLGNASWRILRINSGTVCVEDGLGQPPGIPFWLGEAPGRTAELSRSVAQLRFDVEQKIASSPETTTEPLTSWLTAEASISELGACQLASYFTSIYGTLGVIPSQQKLVLERFFDESGGMQLVIHSPFGIRMNRAWGLALRKRFCRSFNFELQAAATDDAIVLSLGTQHSFPAGEVFHYLNSKTVREVLIQALLDAPMFAIRWRWNATRALALPRQRGGHKVPAPLQRMESENLLAAIFPDQLACLENIAGDREIPAHPLVHQTIDDCLIEAMDIDGLIELLKRIENDDVQCIALDLPEPSPLAHEILNAKPYAFLDNAPLEERRTQALHTRRASESTSSTNLGLGILDAAAIEKVCAEAWPLAANADELHEALLLMGALSDEELKRLTRDSADWLDRLLFEKRVGRLFTSSSKILAAGLSLRREISNFEVTPVFWVAAERLPMLETVYPDSTVQPLLVTPESERERQWERADAIRELLRGRMEVIGPVTASVLVEFLELSSTEIESALLALEREGFILRGKFHPGTTEIEWCDRRLLARIHRLTITRLRAEIQPVPLTTFQRFLLAWQRVSGENRTEGPEGVKAVLDLLDGYELFAAAWEPDVLALRVKEYSPAWLDQLCFTGRIGWGRMTLPKNLTGRLTIPIRSAPISLFARDNLVHWHTLSAAPEPGEFSPDAECMVTTLSQGGALFFSELVKRSGLLPSRAEQALIELSAQGRVTVDSFEGLRALLVPEEKRAHFKVVEGPSERRRHHKVITSVEFAGRWSLLGRNPLLPNAREEAVEVFARVLLRRYGVVFRRILERESLSVPWIELIRVYRRLEARGEIRGGYFVSNVSGEQFALPEAIGSLRSIRKADAKGELITISAADPLNLVGILTPGSRIPAIASHRILLRDGLPIAALKAGKVISLDQNTEEADQTIEHALSVGSMPPALRPYYA
jgi:ATP-dependent Lhr-like helicase